MYYVIIVIIIGGIIRIITALKKTICIKLNALNDNSTALTYTTVLLSFNALNLIHGIFKTTSKSFCILLYLEG